MKASYVYYKFIRGILRLCFPHAENVYEETIGGDTEITEETVNSKVNSAVLLNLIDN